MLRPTTTLMLAAYALSGCQHDPWAFEYARTKPNQTIAGTYVPTKETYRFLNRMYKNVKSSTLELRSDSSFSIKNIAAVWSPFPTADGFETVEGRWSLIKHQEWWAVGLTIKSVRGVDGRWCPKSFGDQAMLIGQHAPYKLHFILGDPDTGEALQYELK